ncbi:hypothetical protein N7517_008804 [Penicillium concentricum]|uniref:Anaphase-promoting complex subunit 4 WD40 domain-containing protein n=1 Tax=Penicillium concentricum TaxID=293559 RepID=A0A9W9V211_9EURO|nr:uncharacterized protein N7517_008804 [Penicillium concentricum]KAJ5365918.1 hypothetical protein N7517_008804 [Penicillium concentricum]
MVRNTNTIRGASSFGFANDITCSPRQNDWLPWCRHSAVENDCRPRRHLSSKVAFSPNGEWLLIPGGTLVRLWNTLGGTTNCTSMYYDKDIHVAALSPNGKYLATGGTKLMIWDVATGLMSPRRSFDVERKVQYVAFSPDSSLVAFWDFGSCQKVFKFRHSNTNYLSLSFSPDGNRLVYRGDYRVWTQDLSTWEFFISSTPQLSKQRSRSSPRMEDT